jgi:hypothetical protein
MYKKRSGTSRIKIPMITDSNQARMAKMVVCPFQGRSIGKREALGLYGKDF